MKELEKTRLQLKNMRRTYAQKMASTPEVNEFWELAKEQLDKQLDLIVQKQKKTK